MRRDALGSEPSLHLHVRVAHLHIHLLVGELHEIINGEFQHVSLCRLSVPIALWCMSPTGNFAKFRALRAPRKFRRKICESLAKAYPPTRCSWCTARCCRCGWVVLRVPLGAAAGAYQGTAEVALEGGHTLRASLTITIGGPPLADGGDAQPWVIAMATRTLAFPCALSND